MIHHLARAFLVRDAALHHAAASAEQTLLAEKHDPSPAPDSSQRPHSNQSPVSPQSPQSPFPRPVRARPITPWSTPARPGAGEAETAAHQGAKILGPNPALRVVQGGKSGMGGLVASRRVRICTDPTDARRTVIAGRFAEVCAALDRLVREQEAIA